MSTNSPFTPTKDLKIVDELATDNGDMCFTNEQLNNMTKKMLRRLAANADTDAVNGKSTKMEIQVYFRCQRSLSEYE